MLYREDLNQDVLTEIFTLVGQGKRAPLLNASLVNHRWHTIAQALIDRTVDLTICSRFKARNLKILKRLSKQPQLQARVQHLVVRDYHTKQRVPLGLADNPPVNAWEPGEYFSEAYELVDSSEPAVEAQVKELQSVITVSPLASFSWAAISPIPLTLAISLAASQSIKVHIKLNPKAVRTAAWSYTPVANHAVVRRLGLLSTNLASLQLCLPNENDQGSPMLRALGELIWDCPRLEILELHTLGRLSVRSQQHNHNHNHNHSGINGPPRALASSARSVKYKDWSTNYSNIGPATCLSKLWSTRAGSVSFPPSLTILSLQHFCVCDTDLTLPTGFLQLHRLHKLRLSCLLLLRRVKDGLSRLQSLTLSLAEAQPYGVDQQVQMIPSAACTTFWSEKEVGEVLASFDRLQHLQVFGNPEAVSELTLMHLGNTLRRLVLLNNQPYDSETALQNITAQSIFGTCPAAGHNTPLTRICQMPSFLSMLGAACPQLEELFCDAPNASTEMDAFLAAITTNLRSLKYLHIRRSMEPYCDTIRPNKFSYARFTTPSVVAIWKTLRQAMPLLELKVTIGRTSSWDEITGGTIIAPKTYARTFIVQRTICSTIDNVPLSDYNVTYCERVEADTALAEGRPGPLLDYWRTQSNLIDEFAEPKNIPVYPRTRLDNGYEIQMRISHPSRSASQDPTYLQQRQHQRQVFQDAVRAQHDAEVEEATHPTREYY